MVSGFSMVDIKLQICGAVLKNEKIPDVEGPIIDESPAGPCLGRKSAS